MTPRVTRELLWPPRLRRDAVIRAVLRRPTSVSWAEVADALG
jgi:hypothetical protein